MAFVLAGLFHVIAFQAQCMDHEIFSGTIVSATHHPYWQAKIRVEDYRTETYTDSQGRTRTRRVHIGHHYRYDNHPEHWTCKADFGSYLKEHEYEIDKTFFDQIAKNFCNNQLRVITPYKSNFHKGDKNDYVADNKMGFVYPTTKWKRFTNRIKASPSLYSYAAVPKEAKVFPYPKCNNPFKSDRLLGTAQKTIDIREFDVMCSMLGPYKKVNIIMIGFGNMSSDIAHLQEASWIGGKKNDLVLCYGGSDPLNPDWTYVFGWTDRNIVKVNLQNILLDYPMDNGILALIEQEVRANYQIKEWDNFNYLQVSPPRWSYGVYVFALILCQFGFWMWAHFNDFSKIG